MTRSPNPFRSEQLSKLATMALAQAAELLARRDTCDEKDDNRYPETVYEIVTRVMADADERSRIRHEAERDGVTLVAAKSDAFNPCHSCGASVTADPSPWAKYCKTCNDKIVTELKAKAAAHVDVDDVDNTCPSCGADLLND